MMSLYCIYQHQIFFDKKKVELLKSRLSLIEEIYDMREVIGENVNIDSYKYIECFRSFLHTSCK